MRAEHAEEYTQALGQIVAGGWRQIALGESLGVPKALGLSTQEWVEQRLGGYVRLSVEERHGAVKELSDDGMSTRQIAGVLGVDHSTVARDAKPVANATLDDEEAEDSSRSPDDPVANATPPIDALAALAADKAGLKAVEKQAKRRERETLHREQTAVLERKAREAGTGWDLFEMDITKWSPAGVDAIITDPPYVGDSIPLYEALRDFAVDVLPDSAPLVVMTWQAILPDVIIALQHEELAYRWTICWRYANVENTADHARRVFDCWKPILVYHKGSMPKDAPMMRDEIANTAPDKDHHEWGQSVEGFRRLVRAFSQPGDTICDPFLGGGTTAIAALGESRRFLGADTSKDAIATTRGRLQG